MRTQQKLKPGQPGTKELTTQCGSQLVCVGHRDQPQRCRRYRRLKSWWKKQLGIRYYIDVLGVTSKLL